MTLWALRDFSNKCDVLITPAESRKIQLLDYGISPDIKVIPNAIDMRRYSNLDSRIIRKKYSISPDEKVLLFVGRIAKEKNIEFLLECFQIISKGNPLAKLMLVGDGPELESLEKKSRRRIFCKENYFYGRSRAFQNRSFLWRS